LEEINPGGKDGKNEPRRHRGTEIIIGRKNKTWEPRNTPKTRKKGLNTGYVLLGSMMRGIYWKK
jgi:hypothetical protein